MRIQDKTPARRIERMQGTLMKLTAQLEECKMMLNQETEGVMKR